MGTVVVLIEGVTVAQPTKGPDCVLRAASNGVRHVRSLCRLTLSKSAPLSSYTKGFIELPRVLPFASGGQRGGPPSMQVEDTDIPLTPGVWECVTTVKRSYVLVSEALDVTVVSRAQAFVALGAVEELLAMGLEDAAVALKSGDYELASVQWINERERRR